MTWWLEDFDLQGADVTTRPVATRRPSTFGERFGAAVTAGRIEDDSWNRADLVEDAYTRDIETRLAPFRGPDFERTGRRDGMVYGPDSADYGRAVPYSPPPVSAEQRRNQQRRSALALIARARAADPEAAKDLPATLEDWNAAVTERRRAEYDEAMEILNAAPAGAWGGAEFFGRAWAGLTDPVSLYTLPFGGSSGAGLKGLLRFAGIEAALGAGSELAIAPRRAEVARELGLSEPNLLADVGLAALASGVFAGGLDLLGKGAARALGYRAAKSEAAAAARPEDISPGRHEGKIGEAFDGLFGTLRRKPDAKAAKPGGAARAPEAVPVGMELAGKTRDKPLSDAFMSDLRATVAPLGDDIGVIIVSGGQDAIGTPGAQRTGSTRHDVDATGHGHTADVVLTRGGRKVTPSEDPELYSRFLYLAAGKFPGIGHYSWGIHVGAGKVAAWGPDLSGATLDPAFARAIEAGRMGADYTSPAAAGEALPALPPVGPDAPEGWLGIRGGIFAHESGGDYDALFGFNQRPGGAFEGVKITEMTVAEALEFTRPDGAYWNWSEVTLGYAATPVGAYQIVGTTLRDVVAGLGLQGDEIMTPELQERMAHWLFRNGGMSHWKSYRGPMPGFTPGNARVPAGGPGRTRRGYTGRDQIVAGERALDVDYAVIDAALLRPASGRFQPRDRSRINSDLWIAERAAKLDPAQLMPAQNAAQGAPLVGPDMMIESGNGRYALIRRAYALHPDRAAAYRRAIQDEGFDVPDGMAEPVLVARRKTGLNDDERAQLVIDAQDAGTARMTASELARAGARQMTADALQDLRPDLPLRDDGNAAFARTVLSGLGASERNALLDGGGTLNADGARRLKQALFARAWDDGGRTAREIIEHYAEIEDTGELKGMMDALEAAAPGFARLRADVETGAVRAEFDITPHVLDALSVVMEARRENRLKGTPIAEAIELMVAVPDMFASPNPLSGALLAKFWRDGRPVPAATIADFLNRYAAEARKIGRDGDLLGAASPADALRAIDRGTFAGLPEVIPPVGREPLPRITAPDMPETAFAKGADSPEAEAADAAALAELRDVAGPKDEAPGLKPASAQKDGGGSAMATLRPDEDFTLPDGNRASDFLADLDEDETLLAVLDACTLGGNT